MATQKYDNQEFSIWVKKLRVDLLMNQKHFAAFLGYTSSSYLSQVESGSATLSDELITRITKKCDLTPEQMERLIAIQENNHKINQ